MNEHISWPCQNVVFDAVMYYQLKDRCRDHFNFLLLLKPYRISFKAPFIYFHFNIFKKMLFVPTAETSSRRKKSSFQ